jgi:hypothetical protein
MRKTSNKSTTSGKRKKKKTTKSSLVNELDPNIESKELEKVKGGTFTGVVTPKPY